METNLIKTIKACIIHDIFANDSLFSLDCNQITTCTRQLYLSKFKKKIDFRLATKRALYVYITDMVTQLEQIDGVYDVGGMRVKATVLKYNNRAILIMPEKKQAFEHLIRENKARIHQILVANFMAYLCDLDKFSIAYINIDNFDILEFMYSHDADLSDYVIDRMEKLFTGLNTNIVPDNIILEEWECSYCEYSDNCTEAKLKPLKYKNEPIILTDVTDDMCIKSLLKSAIKAEGHNYKMKDGQYRISATPACPRKLYYIKTLEGDSPDDELNRMDIGKAFHHYIQKILPSFYMINKEQEIKYVDDNIELIGHYDLRISEDIDKIVDIKTANEFSFRWKVKDFDRYHYLQALQYCAICNVAKGSVLYVDITSFNLFEHEFITDYDEFKKVIRKLHLVENCIKNGTIPDMDPVNKNDCKYCPIKGSKCKGKY